MKQILTVLIPTYNSHKCFMKVVKSYISDSRVKIVVSDDSNNIIEKKLIQSTCSKFNLDYFEGPRENPIKNWNYLLTKIDTPFFVVNHHDDVPDNLFFLDELDFDNIGLKILPCSSRIINNKIHHMESWQQRVFTKICLLIPNSSFNMILAPTAAIVVNSKLKEIIFDENLEWFVDADWYMKLFIFLRKSKLKVKFFKYTRIISHQLKTSITSTLKNKIRKQIKKEKKYLKSYGFYPGHFINAIQYFFLGLILLKTKLKQLFVYR